MSEPFAFSPDPSPDTRTFAERVILPRVKRRVRMRKFRGDDRYAWAVFVDDRPVLTGLSQREAQDYRRLEIERLMKRETGS